MLRQAQDIHDDDVYEGQVGHIHCVDSNMRPMLAEFIALGRSSIWDKVERLRIGGVGRQCKDPVISNAK